MRGSENCFRILKHSNISWIDQFSLTPIGEKSFLVLFYSKHSFSLEKSFTTETFVYGLGVHLLRTRTTPNAVRAFPGRLFLSNGALRMTKLNRMRAVIGKSRHWNQRYAVWWMVLWREKKLHSILSIENSQARQIRHTPPCQYHAQQPAVRFRAFGLMSPVCDVSFFILSRRSVVAAHPMGQVNCLKQDLLCFPFKL